MCCRYEENKLFKTLNDNLLKSYAMMEILGTEYGGEDSLKLYLMRGLLVVLILREVISFSLVTSKLILECSFWEPYSSFNVLHI